MTHSPRLLAVDDDAFSAELIVRVAERCGYEAFATSDSRGVINLVEALHPAVIAVDISMPHVDALELFRLLSAGGYCGRILIVSGQDEQTLPLVQRPPAFVGFVFPAPSKNPTAVARPRHPLSTAFLQQAG